MVCRTLLTYITVSTLQMMGLFRREEAHGGRYDSPVALHGVEDRGGKADAWLDVGVRDCHASVTNLESLVIRITIQPFPRGHLCIRLSIPFYSAYSVSTLSHMFSFLDIPCRHPQHKGAALCSLLPLVALRTEPLHLVSGLSLHCRCPIHFR